MHSEALRHALVSLWVGLGHVPRAAAVLELVVGTEAAVNS